MKLSDLNEALKLQERREHILGLISKARDDANADDDVAEKWQLVRGRYYDSDAGSLALPTDIVETILREELDRIDDLLVDLGVDLNDSTVARPAEAKADAVFCDDADGRWYFWDETQTHRHGGYWSRENAELERARYALKLEGKRA